MAKVHGFVLNPDKKESDRLMESLSEFWSRQVNNARSGLKIHISLTLACLSEKKVPLMVKLLEENKRLFKPVKIRFGKLLAQEDKYLGWTCESVELREMHRKLLDLIQPLTEGEFNPKYFKKDLSDKQMMYLKKYGYHRVLDYFEPHFTIGKYESREVRDAEMKFAPIPEGEFLFDVFQMDETYDSGYDYEKILWEAKLV